MSFLTGRPPTADRHGNGLRTPAGGLLMAALPANLPRYRAIVALDIERSTSRPNPVKGELRNKTYELFEVALRTAGIDKRHTRCVATAMCSPWSSVPAAKAANGESVGWCSMLMTVHSADCEAGSWPSAALI